VQVPYGKKYRLFSLWEIMKYVNPALFLSLGKLLEVSSFKLRPPFKDQILPGHEVAALDFKDSHDNILAEWEVECKELELPASLATVKRLRKLLSESTCTYREYAQLAQEFHGRLEDEMKYRRCLALSIQEAERYDFWPTYWEEIINRFPDTMRDIEEMNKCFALCRYTASMFHSLHVAEWGAIKLGDYIGVTDPKKGWGPTSKRLSELIKGGHSNLPASLAGKFDFLEQMNREIESMVLAWRHKVDHAANHLAIVPNTDFTPDIAEHIIGAIRVFMLRLMEGMP